MIYKQRKWKPRIQVGTAESLGKSGPICKEKVKTSPPTSTNGLPKRSGPHIQLCTNQTCAHVTSARYSSMWAATCDPKTANIPMIYKQVIMTQSHSYALSLSLSPRAYRNSTLSQCQISTMWQSFRVVTSFYKTLDKHGSSKIFDQQDLITINSDHGVTFIDSSNDSHSVDSNTQQRELHQYWHVQQFQASHHHTVQTTVHSVNHRTKLVTSHPFTNSTLSRVWVLHTFTTVPGFTLSYSSDYKLTQSTTGPNWLRVIN